MALTKTKFIQQPINDPACFGAAAAMATGKTLEDFKAFVGRDSRLDQKGFTFQEVSGWLASHNMTFTPLASISNHQTHEEFPGVELKATIDADTMQVLEGYADQLGCSVESAVNGILTRALTQYGARTREGYRYVAPVGHDLSKYSGGYVHYVLTMDSPAIVVVLSDSETDHALYWDGALLWDPSFSEPQNPVRLGNYKVAAWLPVGEFSGVRITPDYNGIILDKDTAGDCAALLQNI
jgi:hypothetical protein